MRGRRSRETRRRDRESSPTNITCKPDGKAKKVAGATRRADGDTAPTVNGARKKIMNTATQRRAVHLRGRRWPGKGNGDGRRDDHPAFEHNLQTADRAILRSAFRRPVIPFASPSHPPRPHHLSLARVRPPPRRRRRHRSVVDGRHARAARTPRVLSSITRPVNLRIAFACGDVPAFRTRTPHRYNLTNAAARNCAITDHPTVVS